MAEVDRDLSTLLLRPCMRAPCGSSHTPKLVLPQPPDKTTGFNARESRLAANRETVTRTHAPVRSLFGRESDEIGYPTSESPTRTTLNFDEYLAVPGSGVPRCSYQAEYALLSGESCTS